MKKRIFIFSVLWAMMFIASAQEVKVSSTKKADDDRIYEIVEVNAQFPDGEQAMYKWLSENIKYPSAAREKGISGRVLAQFVVNRDGKIVDIEIMRSPDISLSKETKRLLKKMPKWKPATQGGKTVRSRFLLPVNFHMH